MNIGVFACDPGGETGLAWAVVNPLARGGVEEAILGKQLHGSTSVTGSERVQIREISSLWASFYRVCVNNACLPQDRVFYVCENFIYSPGTVYGGDSSSISTALIWGVEGYRMGRADEWKSNGRKRQVAVPPVILQTASEAKSYATNARLKELGCWVKGNDHERSAYQHLIFFVARYVQQHA